MPPDDHRRFAGFDLNLRTGELRNAAGPVPLERQPALALSVLVGAAGRLVTRGELRDAIWPQGTHVDFDHGLNYCLRQIRLALGDEARRPQFVQTVPRQGYRFIAPVTGDPPSAAPGPASGPAAPQSAAPLVPAPPRGPRRSTGRRTRWVLTLAAVAGITLVVEAGPRNEDHHRVAMAFACAVHDLLF